jgi:hypothetical protein
MPCGCRSVLHMNLLPDERPCWQVMRPRDGTASLHPSEWWQKDCRSHFWFKNGRLERCKVRLRRAPSCLTRGISRSV